MRDTRQEPPTELRQRSEMLPAGGFTPRGLSRQQAAAYFGVSRSLFDRMVKDRLVPGPIRLYGRVIWDRHKLDLAFAALSDEDTDRQDTAWDHMAL